MRPRDLKPKRFAWCRCRRCRGDGTSQYPRQQAERLAIQANGGPDWAAMEEAQLWDFLDWVTEVEGDAIDAERRWGTG